MGHAVLYDEDLTISKSDGNYYFKNSYPNEPYIIIPKDRVTYFQFDQLKNAQSPQEYSNWLKDWEQQLKHKVTANMSPSGTYRTIFDNLYYVSIEKI